jgi:hypothetical protein
MVMGIKEIFAANNKLPLEVKQIGRGSVTRSFIPWYLFLIRKKTKSPSQPHLPSLTGLFSSLSVLFVTHHDASASTPFTIRAFAGAGNYVCTSSDHNHFRSFRRIKTNL